MIGSKFWARGTQGRSVLAGVLLTCLAACGDPAASASPLAGKGDISDDGSVDMKEVLSAYAQAACRTVEKDERLTAGAAEEIAGCFLTEDFWEAHDNYTHLAGGVNVMGTGTGLAMACSLARGYRCARSFLELGVQADLVGVVGSGVHHLSGLGANADRSVVVRPGAKAEIYLKGHPQAFYLARMCGERSCVKCSGFAGCTPVTESPGAARGPILLEM